MHVINDASFVLFGQGKYFFVQSVDLVIGGSNEFSIETKFQMRYNWGRRIIGLD